MSRRADDAMTDWLNASITDHAAELIRDVHAANVTIGFSETAPDGNSADYQCEFETVVVPPGDLGLRLNLTRVQDARLVWQGSRRFAQCGLSMLDDPALLKLLQNLSDALGQAILTARTRRPMNGGALASMESTLRKVFSMEPISIQEADEALEKAFDAEPHPSYLAWRSQIRTIQFAERLNSDLEALAEEARFFARHALELDQFNAVALSSSANAMLLLDRNVEEGRALAKRALESNPTNPFAWWSASAGAMYQNDLAAAAKAVDMGAAIAANSRRTFWWDVQKGAVALMMGEIETARRAFLASHQKRPKFRPPLRYLIALESAAGNLESAARFAERLKVLEPEFSVAQLLDDPLYPASLLARAPKLDLSPLNELRGK